MWQRPKTPLIAMAIIHGSALVVLIALFVVGAVQPASAEARFIPLAGWLIAGVFFAPLITIGALVWWAILRKRARRALTPNPAPPRRHAHAMPPVPVPAPAAEAEDAPQPTGAGKPEETARALVNAISRDYQRLTFTAIDVETANETRHSICAIGLARVVDGSVEAVMSWHVSPPGGPRFTNTGIHGITATDVQNAASWVDSLEKIADIAGDGPLVAYNAAFDGGALAAANRESGISGRDLVVRDALQLARAHLDLPRYRLPDVARHFGLPAFEHHDPALDAVACAAVTCLIAEQVSAASIGELWQSGAAGRRRSGAALATLSRSTSSLPRRNADADPSHPLYGTCIAFTGELNRFTRTEARRLAAEHGAYVTHGPTMRTELIVIGDFDLSTLRPGATLSKKMQRAIELRDAGQPITFLNEDQFVQMLGGTLRASPAATVASSPSTGDPLSADLDPRKP